MEPSIFQPGDICPNCQQNGMHHRLRSFYIDINEQIVKCESVSCLYPYINDFSDSEDDGMIEEKHINASKSASTPSFAASSNANDNLDDTESVRFVEALLCINGSNNGAEALSALGSTVENNSSPSFFTLQPASCVPPMDDHVESTSPMADHVDSAPPSFSVKFDTFKSMSHPNDKMTEQEGISFIDSLFSNSETHASVVSNKNVLENQLPTQASTASVDMPVLNFDFTDMQPPNAEEFLPAKKKQKSQIEIQCIQTVKAGFTNRNIESIIKCERKPEIAKEEKSIEQTTKPRCITKEVGVTTETTTVTPKVADSNSEMRISRYFEALQMKLGNLQKSQTKEETSLERKKRKKQPPRSNVQQPKPDNAAGRRLVNVLQVLQSKKQK
ncbi:uncharacterized protein LOC129244430 [Anastrepha obliqua]|uniref:uncharacterized protein LOC129244430 n=1 Tax=Anastrepha obliqua TaxID=95512 RepID=UPI00240A14B0|nr:uncharacterized protein LOC129244430 [Anastrepha obliqua]